MDYRQFLAGSVAGCTGQIVGHPLDTIKVRLQTGSGGGAGVTSSSSGGANATSARQAASQLYAEGGRSCRAFFRGLSLPLLTKSLEQCLAFGVRGAADNLLRSGSRKDSRWRRLCPDPASPLGAGLSGAAAGAATAALLAPVYLIKVQLQATPPPSSSPGAAGALAGPLAAARATVRRRGLRGLYTGALPLFLGTTVGYACRFATYDRAVGWMEREGGAGRVAATIVGGGIAGMVTWASHYPLDLVTARMEADVVLSREGGRIGRGKGRCRMGMLDHFGDIYRTQGLRGYFRGIGPCLLRAFPVNAAIFLTYEFCMERIPI